MTYSLSNSIASRLIIAGFLFFAAINTASAELQKFVYVYDNQGTLLAPNNTADQCPDPDDATIINSCHGVRVTAAGTYRIEFDEDIITSADDVALIAKSYEFISAHSKPGISIDTYLEIDSKRRLENISPKKHNKGVDINALSEVSVKAVDKHYKSDIGKGKRSIPKIDIGTNRLNGIFSNSTTDNDPTSTENTTSLGLIETNQVELTDTNIDALIETAELALDNQDNEAVLGTIEKNLTQSLINPELLIETTDRIFTQVSEIINGDSANPVVMLDADKYVAHVNETINLTTENSINPARFFGYTWVGTESDNTRATFSRSEPGSYLICVSGEAETVENSSSDCVRLEIKPISYAIITARPLLVPVNDSVDLSGFFSVGANSYSWSTDAGTFENRNAMETTWSTPAVKGFHTITLMINDEAENTDSVDIQVYDMLPIAIATTNHTLIYNDDDNPDAILTSSSIATDGSAVDSIEWHVIEQPANSSPVLSSSTTVVSNFTTDTLGKYIIRHTAYRDGISDSVDLEIEVRKHGVPVADAGPDIDTFRGVKVKLDGSDSHDPDDIALTYDWTSNGGTLGNASSNTATFTTDTLGELTATLNVSNSVHTATDTATINVRNRLPVASDDFYDPDLGEITVANLHAFDSDGDPLTFTLLTEPENGSITIDPSGLFVYEPGGLKGCKYHPDHKPYDNLKNGKDVPVLKLCANKFVVSVGETVTLTVSDSINATKIQGYEWIGAEGIDDRNATFIATEIGIHEVCITGNIGNSKNTSTACLEIEVKDTVAAGDNPVIVDTGYIDTIEFLVNDGYGNSNIATVVLRVGWKNTPPVADDQTLTTDEDVDTTGTLIANDVDKQLLVYSVVSNGSKGSLTITDAITGAFTYSPNANAFGNDTVTFKAFDGHDYSSPATLSININGFNDKPVANNGSYVTQEDSALIGAVLSAIEPDGEALTYQIVSNGSIGNAVLTDENNGIFSYTPNANNKGHDSFTFLVNDGHDNSNIAIASITVEAVNDTPIAHDLDRIFTSEDIAFGGTLNAEDIDLDSLSYRLMSNGSLGTAIITDTATGAFTYTPNAGVNGSDSISYVANDGTIDSNIAFVPITISPNEAPTASDVSISTDRLTKIDGSLSATDPESNALTYQILSAPGKGSVQLLNITTGTFSYTPNGTETGSDSFSYTAKDHKSSSNVAIVNITINEFNNAPIANHHSFTAFEGIPYSNILSGSDTENSPLQFAIARNGLMGGAEFDNASSGQFTYNPTAGRSGDDHFNFTVNDGDKSSAEATVSAHIISTAEACNGPQAPGYDTDEDGYADFIELAFGTDINNNSVTPAGLNPVDYSVSFTDDDDSDGFADYVELWLGTDYKDADSVPTDSLTRGLPTCLNGGADHVAPTALAFDILTPTVTITGSNNVASFAITATDNSSGVKNVTVRLQSPSGQLIKAVANQDPATLMYYINFNSDTFSYYAEAGIWKVMELELTDAAGNVRILGTADLVERAFPTDVQVINPNSDVAVATLLDFIILTPTVDLADANPIASFNVSGSDTTAGISRINVTLRSPSGADFRWGEYLDATHPNSCSKQIDTNAFDSFSEMGDWSVSELSIADEAGNTLKLNTTQLQARGYDTVVSVINGQLDTGLPLLDDFQVLTPKVYPASGDAKAMYSVTASDAKSGIHSIAVTLTSPSGNQSLNATLTSADDSSPLTAELHTNFFSSAAEAGIWQVSAVVISDGANNSATFNTADLTARGFDTTVHVIYFGFFVNTAPVAYADHISLDEDTPYNGQLNAFDADGHSLSYHVDSEPENGSVTIDAASGTFTYTPTANYFGSDSFTFYVDDGYNESNIATVSITVNPINDKPVANDLDIITDQDTMYAGSLSASDIESDPLTFSIVSNGNLGTASFTNASNGAFEYMPNPGVSGDDSFTFEVSDGTDVSDIATVNVTIIPRNDLVNFNVLTKTLNANVATVWAHSTVQLIDPAKTYTEVHVDLVGPSGQIITTTINLTSSSSDPMPLIKEIDTVADNLEVGTWTYKNLWAQKIGEASRLIVDDLVGAGFDATITVGGNSLPVASDSTITTQENIPYVGNLVANDANSDALTYSIVSNGSLGTVTMNGNCVCAFTYTPNLNTIGTDSFTFKVNDGSNDSNIATVTVNINPANGTPVAYGDSITAFRNLAYGGTLSGADSEGDTLSYHLAGNGSLGNVVIDANNGSYVYTPNTNVVGNDSFSFYVSDGTHQSSPAIVTVNILHEDQVCHYGDTMPGADSDGDGYADVVEIALSTDLNDANSTPEGINPADLGVSFTDDDDNDGFPDYVEIWMGTNPYNDTARPTDSALGLLPDCFNAGSDGIKPRLLAFNIDTPVVDLSSGNGLASYSMTLIDNASGIRRVRIDLMSPSGAFATTSTSFDSFPVVKSLKLDSSTFSAFSEQGVWQITGITLYDEAGNKRSLSLGELTSAGFPTDITMANLNSDSNAPTLQSFSLVSASVNAVGGAATIGFNIDASDDLSGINSVNINLTSPGGVVVEAVATYSDSTPTTLSATINSAPLSEFAEQGAWTISSLLLTDAAGNSAQFATDLDGLGFPSAVAVTNTGGDGVAPGLTNFSILTPEVYPGTGTAHMSFAVSALDDVSGIEKIRIDLQGPAGQYLAAWGYFFDSTPLSASAQVDTAVLSTLLQAGSWTITEIEVFDLAGNSSRMNLEQLTAEGYSTNVTVSY